ncbi:MAG: M23 family metallopeptidase [Spirochaetes bacterium]|nr:M23 family metallopeptidase [Spirochaetota bacterium]
MKIAPRIQCTSLILPIIAAFGIGGNPMPLEANDCIPTLPSLDRHNPILKEIRTDINKTIYAIKSARPIETMPSLKIFRYKIEKGDTFWSILTATGLDIDTIVSLNCIGSADEIEAGKTIFIPNMRGIVFRNAKNASLHHIAAAFKIAPEYLARANGGSLEEISQKEYLFIPLGKLSSVERSLFLGTGFLNPLRDSQKTSDFGMRRDPFTHRRQFHGGIDLACKVGSKVYAARSGVVTFAGYKNNYGFVVEVSHSHGYRSIYGHLSKIFVSPGKTVTPHTVLGLSGNTGRSTGPHLHFEVRRNASPINPLVLTRS